MTPEGWNKEPESDKEGVKDTNGEEAAVFSLPSL